MGIASHQILQVRRIRNIRDSSQVIQLHFGLQYSALQGVDVQLLVIPADSNIGSVRINGNRASLVLNGQRKDLLLV